MNAGWHRDRLSVSVAEQRREDPISEEPIHSTLIAWNHRQRVSRVVEPAEVVVQPALDPVAGRGGDAVAGTADLTNGRSLQPLGAGRDLLCEITGVDHAARQGSSSSISDDPEDLSADSHCHSSLNRSRPSGRRAGVEMHVPTMRSPASFRW